MKTILTLALLTLASCAQRPIAMYSYEIWIFEDTVIVDRYNWSVESNQLDSLIAEYPVKE